MNDKMIWKKYYYTFCFRWFLNHINDRTLQIKYNRKRTRAGKTFVTGSEFSNWVEQAINNKRPFMVARYGSVEADMMLRCLGVECGAIKNVKSVYFQKLQNNAGFFPNDMNLIPNWLECMKFSSSQMDVLCYWEAGGQEYMADKQGSDNLMLTELDNLQPFWSERPWTASLKGKKVLVVHPFAETITSQYEKRKFIWKNPDILPEFTLYTVKAVQTLAGTQDVRFETWFDALDWMFDEGMKYDFDVAIVACGAYGMPLAAKFKAAGKQAIHWGGMSQIWFGIKGGRWDNNPRVNQFYNESWVRPSTGETPSNKQKVEGGCYW